MTEEIQGKSKQSEGKNSENNVLIKRKKYTKTEIDNLYEDSINEFQSGLDFSHKEGLLSLLPIPVIIFLPPLIAYIFGIYKSSLIYLLIIEIVVYLSFKTRIDAFIKTIRAMIYINARREKWLDYFESTEWINYLTKRVWPFLEPIVAKQVLKQANEELQKNLVKGISELKLAEFTLGSTPPYMLGIKVHECNEKRKLKLDIGFNFTPNKSDKVSTFYINQEPIISYNSRIVLKTKIGPHIKGIGVSLPILVKDLSFEGILRIEATLTESDNLIDEVEICFLEMPRIGFGLQPLKSINIMGVPGLSNLFHLIIKKVLSKQLVNPNSLIIDVKTLSKFVEEPLGMIRVHFFQLLHKKERKCRVEFGIDCKMEYETKVREGFSPKVNEIFYILVRKKDDLLNMTIISAQTDRALGSSALKINKIMKAREVFEYNRFVYDEKVTTFLNTFTSFYPFKKTPTNAAYVEFIVDKITDIRRKGDLQGTRYNTKITVVVANIHNKQNTVKKTINNQEVNLLKNDDVYNEMFKKANESIKDKTKQSQTEPYFVFSTKEIKNTASPSFNHKMGFFSNDLKNMRIWVFIEIDKKLIETIKIDLKELEKYTIQGNLIKLRSLISGKLYIKSEMKYIRDFVHKDLFVEYVYSCKITLKKIKSLYMHGTCNVLLRTKHTSYIIPINFGNYTFQKDIVLPLTEDDNIDLYLYKEEKEFVGKGTLIKKGKLVEDNISYRISEHSEKLRPIKGKTLIFNKKLKTHVNIWNEDLDTGFISTVYEIKKLKTVVQNDIKIIQIKITDISGIECKYYIKFISNKIPLRSTKVIDNNALSEVFTLLHVQNDLKIEFRRFESGKDDLLGEGVIPLRNLSENIKINNINCFIKTNVLETGFKTVNTIEIGYLKVTLVEINNINPKRIKRNKRIYTSVHLNDEKIYTSKASVLKETNMAVTNESFIVKVNSFVDVLRISIKNKKTFGRNEKFYYAEIPLYFLKQEDSEIDVVLMGANDFKETKCKYKIKFELFENLIENMKEINIKNKLKFYW